MRSPTMGAIYCQLPPIEKVAFVSWTFDVGYDSMRFVQNLFSEKPYCTVFIC